MPTHLQMISATATLAVAVFLLHSPVAPQETVYPTGTWETRAPADVRMNSAKLDALAEHVGGRGCVIRHGFIVHEWGDVTRRGDVASAAKPFYSHFIMKAIEDGRIGGIDEPVLRFEPRLDSINADLGRPDRGITWRHMANQTACYGLEDEPGSAYDYNDWHMALLWDTLFVGVYAATWDSVDDAVLRPLLTDILQCEDDPTFMAFGTGDRPGRTAISPRDFARFGLLYLRDGSWRGQQLISADHARLATRSSVATSIPRATGGATEMIDGQRTIGSRAIPDNQTDHMGSYSFLWWTNGVDREGLRHWPDAPHDAFGAFGHGGPRAMVVVPSLDAIVSWNDADVKSREAENEALRLLAEACLDRDPMFGQIIVDLERPDVLRRKGGDPFVMCGPGDPEGFLYRGDLAPDGTRDGDQMALIRKLAATGANCLYAQAIRSHGGDGDPTQNPFVDHDPAKGLSEPVLAQWDAWLVAMDEADICLMLFIYDDSARVWDTGDAVGDAERRFIESLVERFQHHRNLIWCVGEEYEERYSPKRVSGIAATIRETDDHDHPIAVHKLNGLGFDEFAGDPNIDQFAVQYNVDTARELHDGLVQARRRARGRYGINMSECADMGTGAELRKKIWASAMAGAHVMVLGMDVDSTPSEDLYACGRLVTFMEAVDATTLEPHDELAAGDTDYVLAQPGETYVAYSSHAETAPGISELPAGTYSLSWLDCATGGEVRQHAAELPEGAQDWPVPEGLGAEVAACVRRVP
ncbi:MAG TPA: hypothetical protein QGH10_24725 [Armatimonadota bacterium]|nr:hypothetical protein [Armatimonadota bacterium]